MTTTWIEIKIRQMHVFIYQISKQGLYIHILCAHVCKSPDWCKIQITAAGTLNSMCITDHLQWWTLPSHPELLHYWPFAMVNTSQSSRTPALLTICNGEHFPVIQNSCITDHLQWWTLPSHPELLHYWPFAMVNTSQSSRNLFFSSLLKVSALFNFVGHKTRSIEHPMKIKLTGNSLAC